MDDKAEEAFLKWARTRNVGCLFAQAMFSAFEKYDLQLIALDGVDAKDVSSAISAAVDHPTTEGIVVVLPSIRTPEALAIILSELSREHAWQMRLDREQVDVEEYIVLGLDVPVGEEEGTPVLAEVVVFAPFDYLPHTRRAPVTALTMRTKPNLSGDPLPGRHERRANLAAIKMDLPTKSFTALWKKSQALREELDGKENPLARARVAIGFPLSLWESATEVVN